MALFKLTDRARSISRRPDRRTHGMQCRSHSSKGFKADASDLVSQETVEAKLTVPVELEAEGVVQA